MSIDRTLIPLTLSVGPTYMGCPRCACLIGPGLVHGQPCTMAPPIAGSSVPRCPCQGAQPCACESYGRRLELSQRTHASAALEADRKLAIAEAALNELAPGMKILEALAAVRAAREILV